MRKIRKNDNVIVIVGKSKGEIGRVKEVIEAGARVIVEGVNFIKKHVKPNPQLNQQGGIQQLEAPIAISNVMLYNPKTKKGDRVGFRIENGVKKRYFKSNEELVDL